MFNFSKPFFSNRKRKLIVFTVGVLLITTVLRETGIIEINLYKSKVTCHTASNWNNIILDLTVPGEITAVNPPCNPNGLIALSSIEASYKSFSKKDNDTCRHIQVEVTSVSPGAIWIPGIKYADFSATAVCNDIITLTVKTGKRPQIKQYQLKGSFTFTGHANILGFCSYREAKQLIVQNILEQAYYNTRQQLTSIRENN